MPTKEPNTWSKDVGGIWLPCVFIIIALGALWDTTNMLDSDSYVFPRAIAIAMIALNLLLIGRALLKMPSGQEEKHPTGGSTNRRVSLIAGMLISCVLMPYLGFLLSGIITFMLLMVVSMYDEWTAKLKIIYPLVALSLVVGFYLLFSKLLLVPLPVGFLFE